MSIPRHLGLSGLETWAGHHALLAQCQSTWYLTKGSRGSTPGEGSLLLVVEGQEPHSPGMSLGVLRTRDSKSRVAGTYFALGVGSESTTLLLGGLTSAVSGATRCPSRVGS